MDLTVNYPKIQNNKQTFGKMKFKDGTASELANQAGKFYPKGSKGNSMYDEFLLALDSFILRQAENKEVDIVVKRSKDWLGRKRLVAEVVPAVDSLEMKTFKQDIKPKKGNLLLFLCEAEKFANKQQEKVKDILMMNHPNLK